jgi:hypothetical protein
VLIGGTLIIWRAVRGERERKARHAWPSHPPGTIKTLEPGIRRSVTAGSGVDTTNLITVLETADALIVGTAFKQDGVTTNAVDSQRVGTFMHAAPALRSAKK